MNRSSARAVWLGLVLGASALGCGKQMAATMMDSGTAMDLSITTIDLTEKFASKMIFTVGASDGGAAVPSSLEIDALWSALQTGNGPSWEVDSSWQLCSLPLPGMQAAYDEQGLATIFGKANLGVLMGNSDGSRLLQPTFPVIGGAKLGGAPLTDPLPTASAPVCSDTVTSNCLYIPTIGGVPVATTPGVQMTVTDTSLPADKMWIDFRLQLGLDVTAKLDGTLNGAVTNAAVEYHVIGCHMRGGAMCTPSQVAAMEAARPAITFASATVRSHAQGGYFSCPQFLGNTEGAVTGIELQPDAGVPGDLGTMSLSWSTIQDDMDQLGCASCHQSFVAPGEMNVVLKPWTPDLVRRNYDMVLPYTRANTMRGLAGGRFVNQTPLPAAVRQRWLSWIDQGAPF